MLETLMTQQKGVNNCVSADLVSLIERILKIAVRSRETTAVVAEAVVDNPDSVLQLSPFSSLNNENLLAKERRLKNSTKICRSQNETGSHCRLERVEDWKTSL